MTIHVRHLAFLTCLAALGGCYHSTRAELRDSPPTQTAVVQSTNYQTLAACVMRRLEANMNMAALTAQYHLTERPEQKLATVAGSTQRGSDVGWFIEVRFQQRDLATVGVETRKASWVLGTQTEPIAWNAVDACSGK